MTRLRTLKDITIVNDEPYVYDSNGNNNFGEIPKDLKIALTWVTEIRQEAILYVKSILIGNFGMTGENRNPTSEERRIAKEAVVDWIRYFFNITNEDLK